jgi:hypothetical protein
VGILGDTSSGHAGHPIRVNCGQRLDRPGMGPVTARRSPRRRHARLQRREPRRHVHPVPAGRLLYYAFVNVSRSPDDLLGTMYRLNVRGSRIYDSGRPYRSWDDDVRGPQRQHPVHSGRSHLRTPRQSACTRRRRSTSRGSSPCAWMGCLPYLARVSSRQEGSVNFLGSYKSTSSISVLIGRS